MIYSIGSLTLHQMVNGESPSSANKLADIVTTNQGSGWNFFETTVDLSGVPANDVVEVSCFWYIFLLTYNVLLCSSTYLCWKIDNVVWCIMWLFYSDTIVFW